MATAPLTMARRHVLGTLHARCEPITEPVPVYLAVTDGAPELMGHVDEAHGRFADAMSFHLADDVCKKLSAGHYTYSFEYDHAGEAEHGMPARIVLRSITLNSRKGYPKPEPRTKAADRTSEKGADASLPDKHEAGRAESE